MTRAHDDTNGAELVDYGCRSNLVIYACLGFLLAVFWTAVGFAVATWMGWLG